MDLSSSFFAHLLTRLLIQKYFSFTKIDDFRCEFIQQISGKNKQFLCQIITSKIVCVSYYSVFL